eukprot:TRINITY_DN15137_c0_g1_i1.p1 TRINITY_DN15137_c0_g1~~TRINITY_DN15137_c0_g1_i1.p1  ORF type:complete len:571 (+),score=221.77 TRINITY_DN15137_c0_g1_i1:140-1852(+)
MSFPFNASGYTGQDEEGSVKAMGHTTTFEDWNGTMSFFETEINVNSEEFIENYTEMEGLIETLNENLEKSLYQGKDIHVKRHIERGRLLARDRVELLLDEDSPFLELCTLAGYEQENTAIGASMICGIGLVCGVECLIKANVNTIKGGSINEATGFKSGRSEQIAWENCLPTINLIQSAGADLRQQEKIFHKGGAGFRELARRSKRRLTTVAVVFGSSTAGGAYLPGMSDYVVMVKDQAKVFLAGPPLVKMATGEVVDDETLGGALMHSTISGVSDFLAYTEHDAIWKARNIIANLQWEKRSVLPKLSLSDHIEEPIYDIDEIIGIASANIKKPYDSREIIARIVDGSKFFEFKKNYGTSLVTCFAKIHGIEVGIISNNGVLFSESANKGTQFIHLCNQQNIPLLFLQNITGFMVGSEYEQGGIIKHGSHFINAVSNSTVPAITIVMGASYGAGNYGMCGRAYNPRFLFSWPQSKCSVMGPEQLSGVMDIVFRESAKRQGKKINEEAHQMRSNMLRQMVEKTSDVYFTSSRCIDDGIIDPRDTRNVVGLCLSVVYSAPVRGSNIVGVSRM